MSDNADLEMRAFELDPNAPIEPRSDIAHLMAAKYGTSVEQAKHGIESITQQGRELGIDFNYGNVKSTNTLDAHRLTKYAHDHGNTEVEQLLFDAYFVDSELIGDRDVLIRIATEAGLDPESVRQMLESEAYLEEVRVDEAVAHQLGVTGVPFFVIDEKYAIPGCMPVDGFKKALTQCIE